MTGSLTSDVLEAEYDVVIIGDGAAGLSAASMLGRSKRRVLLFGTGERRNDAVRHMYNVPFFEGENPAVVYERMESSVAGYGVNLIRQHITSIEDQGSYFQVTTADGLVACGRRVLVAAGRMSRLPAWVPPSAWGATVVDCPYCHSYERDGGAFVTVSTSANAVWLAKLARQYASTMTAVVEEEAALKDELVPRLEATGARVLHDTVTTVVRHSPQEIELRTASGVTLPANLVILGGVVRPNTDLVSGIDIDFRPDGYPVVDWGGRTSHKRLYFAGNVPGGGPYYMWLGASNSGISAARRIWEDIAWES